LPSSAPGLGSRPRRGCRRCETTPRCLARPCIVPGPFRRPGGGRDYFARGALRGAGRHRGTDRPLVDVGGDDEAGFAGSGTRDLLAPRPPRRRPPAARSSRRRPACVWSFAATRMKLAMRGSREHAGRPDQGFEQEWCPAAVLGSPSSPRRNRDASPAWPTCPMTCSGLTCGRTGGDQELMGCYSALRKTPDAPPRSRWPLVGSPQRARPQGPVRPIGTSRKA